MKPAANFAAVCLLLTAFCCYATTRYVNPASTSPVSPYFSWSTAATNIQQALDASFIGDTILVTNGIYQTGGRTFGATSNRVFVSKAVVIQSVNGPAVTVIKGYQVPGTTNGSSAIRCIYMADGSRLTGFTLTNGATFNEDGGGLFCNTLSTVIVSNCVFAGNAAKTSGGGAYGGTYYNCVFTGNTSFSGYGGGGAAYAGLNNCLIVSNSSAVTGGGTSYGTMKNCTVTGNYAAMDGGGSYNGTHRNCIIYHNAIGTNTQYAADVYQLGCSNCCIAETNGLGLGSGANITNAPVFADVTAGNFHLLAGSACINAGINANAPSGLDPDGNPRIAGGTVDIGAYEFQAQAAGTITAWLQLYGLTSDEDSAFADTDGDGMNNVLEWLAGTNPTNAASVLRLTQLKNASPEPGLVVSWQSVAGRSYNLQRAVNIVTLAATADIQTNIAGLPGTTSFTDTTATNAGPYFYRVEVP